METRQFILTAILECPDCHGSQSIYDPTGFWNSFGDRIEKERPDSDAVQGIYRDCCVTYGVSPDMPPIEETPCDCGTGIVRAKVPLDEALTALGYPTASEIMHMINRVERDAYHTNNVASCLANGIMPD